MVNKDIIKHEKNLNPLTLHLIESVDPFMASHELYPSLNPCSSLELNNMLCTKLIINLKTSLYKKKEIQENSSLQLIFSECEDKVYGRNCSKCCGYCAKDEVCHKATGECPNGCQSHFHPPMCQGNFIYMLPLIYQ